MIDLIRGAFRGLFSVLVVILIIGVIIGGIIFMTESPLIGFLGIIIGLILVICLTGAMATFLNMDQNLEQLNYNMKKILSSGSFNATSSGSSYVQNERECKKCGKMIGSGYKSCPHCGYSENIKLPINNSIPIVLSKINETKKCNNCGQNVDADELKCPKCKKEEFS